MNYLNKSRDERLNPYSLVWLVAYRLTEENLHKPQWSLRRYMIKDSSFIKSYSVEQTKDPILDALEMLNTLGSIVAGCESCKQKMKDLEGSK